MIPPQYHNDFFQKIRRFTEGVLILTKKATNRIEVLSAAF
jgi:hypothetical protein